MASPEHGASFWRNELTGVAQWQHPIDEFVKSVIKALRTPLHPHSAFVLASLLGEGAGWVATC